MGFDKVIELHEVYSDVEANQFLDKKYKLLKILQTRRHTNETEEVRPCYILGKMC